MDGGVLTIKNATFSDAGDYECIVKSAVGRISSKKMVVVEGPPGPPGGVQVVGIVRTSATIQWTDGASNDRPITGYTISGCTNWNSTYINLAESKRQRRFDRLSVIILLCFMCRPR